MTNHSIAIGGPIFASRSDFEQASARETFTIQPGVYPVEFLSSAGQVATAEDAYYARVVLDIVDAEYSDNGETPRPSGTVRYSPTIYGHEFRAGAHFWAKGRKSAVAVQPFEVV